MFDEAFIPCLWLALSEHKLNIPDAHKAREPGRGSSSPVADFPRNGTRGSPFRRCVYLGEGARLLGQRLGRLRLRAEKDGGSSLSSTLSYPAPPPAAHG